MIPKGTMHMPAQKRTTDKQIAANLRALAKNKPSFMGRYNLLKRADELEGKSDYEEIERRRKEVRAKMMK